jgi:hypothetical protein
MHRRARQLPCQQARAPRTFTVARGIAPTLVQTIDVFAVMWDVFLNGRKTSPLWGDRPSFGDNIHLTTFGHQVWAWRSSAPLSNDRSGQLSPSCGCD